MIEIDAQLNDLNWQVYGLVMEHDRWQRDGYYWLHLKDRENVGVDEVYMSGSPHPRVLEMPSTILCRTLRLIKDSRCL